LVNWLIDKWLTFFGNFICWPTNENLINVKLYNKGISKKLLTIQKNGEILRGTRFKS